MLNKYKSPDTIAYENTGSSTITGGSLVKCGGKMIVPVTDIKAGAVGAAEVGGVYSVVLSASVSSAYAQGATVYAPALPSDGSNLTLTSAASATAIGQLEEKVTSGATVLKVRLN